MRIAHSTFPGEKRNKRTKKPLNYMRLYATADSVVTPVNRINQVQSLFEAACPQRPANPPSIRHALFPRFFFLLRVSISFFIFPPRVRGNKRVIPACSYCPSSIHATRKRFRFRISLHWRICNEFYGSHVYRFRLAKRNSTSAVVTVVLVKSTKEKSILKIWGKKEKNSLDERLR